MGSAAVARPALVDDGAPIVPVAVGLDHRGGEVAVHGWTESSGVALADALRCSRRRRRSSITDIDRDGMLAAPTSTASPAPCARPTTGDRQRRRRHARRRAGLAAIAASPA